MPIFRVGSGICSRMLHPYQESNISAMPQTASSTGTPDEPASSSAHATAAMIRQMHNPVNLVEELRNACHNSGVKSMLVLGTASLMKLVFTNSLNRLFDQAFHAQGSGDSAEQKSFVANVLAASIGGSLFGLAYTLLEQRVGNSFNQYKAATIRLPVAGEALETFNFWFSAFFAMHGVLMAGLALGMENRMFDTKHEKEQGAVHLNGFVMDVLGGVLIMAFSYFAARVGSTLAVAATPAEKREEMLTVDITPDGCRVVDNNVPFRPREETSFCRGANERQRRAEIMVARVIAGGGADVWQTLMQMILQELPFFARNGADGQVFGKFVSACAAMSGKKAWRRWVVDAQQGVVLSKLKANPATEVEQVSVNSTQSWVMSSALRIVPQAPLFRSLARYLAQFLLKETRAAVCVDEGSPSVGRRGSMQSIQSAESAMGAVEPASAAGVGGYSPSQQHSGDSSGLLGAAFPATTVQFRQSFLVPPSMGIPIPQLSFTSVESDAPQPEPYRSRTQQVSPLASKWHRSLQPVPIPDMPDSMPSFLLGRSSQADTDNSGLQAVANALQHILGEGSAEGRHKESPEQLLNADGAVKEWVWAAAQELNEWRKRNSLPQQQHQSLNNNVSNLLREQYFNT